MRLVPLILSCLTLTACIAPADLSSDMSPWPDWSDASTEPPPTTDMSSPPPPTDMSNPPTPPPVEEMTPDPPVDPPDMSSPDQPAPDMPPQDMPDPVTPGACDLPGVTFCDDFEAASLDSAYREINFGDPAFTLDTSRANTGSQSVRVTSGGFTQMLAIPVPGPTFYGRVYLTSDTPMNNGHNTYLNAGEGDGDPNHGEWIRIGEHRTQLEVNRKSDDAELLSSGDYNSLEGATQLAPDTWHCLEFLFDGPGQQVRVWVDGQEVTKLHAMGWTAAYETFKFGYERYHGPDKTLWYDDLALGSERIGCL